MASYPCTDDPSEILEKVTRVYEATEEIEGAVDNFEQKLNHIATSSEANAGKFDKFVNGGLFEEVQLGMGSPTPTLRNLSHLMKSAAATFDSSDISGKFSDAANGGEVLRMLADRFGDITNVKDFGAVGDGETDDSSAIASAMTAAEGCAVFFPSFHGENYGIETENTYKHEGNSYDKCTGVMLVSGTRAHPTSNPHALIFAEKFSSATRTGYGADEKEWDNGAIYAQLVQVEGSAYGAAITGYAKANSSTSGQIIGIHGRGAGNNLSSQVWGGWLYGTASAGGCKHIIGLEININNQNEQGDRGWGVPLGSARGLVINTVDGHSVPGQMAAYIGRGGSANAGWHTGIRIEHNSIEPSEERESGVPDNEAIHLPGSRSVIQLYGGIRFGDASENSHWFSYGISFSEATFSNYCAILLGEGQRIKVGQHPSSSRYLEFSRENNCVDFNNLSIRINGSQVLSTKKTGWAGSNSGEISREPFNTATVTTEELAKRVRALIHDLKNHGLIGA